MNDPTEIGEYKRKQVPEITENDISYLEAKFLREKPKSFNLYWSENREDKTLFPTIENTSYAGIIQLENARVHFSTKVKTNLFYMLSFLKSEDNFVFDPLKVIEIEEGANFFDILGRLFLNELEVIVNQGILKTYIRREEDLRYLKGKLLFNQQISHNLLLKPKFCCKYYDLTYDNLENQIVLRATSLLIGMIRFNEKLRFSLLKLEKDLKEEVSLNFCISQKDCDFVSYNRLNQHYKPIIDFSKLIFEESFIRSVDKGKSKGFNFIVNMWQVYEDFVTEMIKEVINEDSDFSETYLVVSQLPFNTLVKEKKIITRPDVIIKNKKTGKYPLIIDAKYKRHESNADFYQLIAYSLAIPESQACCLIYPESEKNDRGEYTVVKNVLIEKPETVMLYTRTVSLFAEENEDFKSFIKRVKEKQIKPLLVDLLTTDKK